uniref:Uncharacterized protein n=1 Tax=Glossina pallidipes TaxID=7398 RepID=A0A1B0A8Q6_GLOPL
MATISDSLPLPPVHKPSKLRKLFQNIPHNWTDFKVTLFPLAVLDNLPTLSRGTGLLPTTIDPKFTFRIAALRSYHFGQIDGWYFQQVRFNGGQFFAAHFDVGEAAIGYNEPTEHDHGRTQKAPHYVPRDSGTK